MSARHVVFENKIRQVDAVRRVCDILEKKRVLFLPGRENRDRVTGEHGAFSVYEVHMDERPHFRQGGILAGKQ